MLANHHAQGPGYLSLADELQSAIEEMEPGTRLPSEHELEQLHRVSRVTARSAMQELEKRHVVRRVRGSGTFVALRLDYPLTYGSTPSWSSYIRESGHSARYRIVAVEQTRSTAPVARALDIPRGRAVTRVERLGFVDDLVAVHQVSWFPRYLVPDLEGLIGPLASTARLLRERYGFATERRWVRAELEPVPPAVAELLELSGRPMAWRISTSNQCRLRHEVVEFSQAWMRVDAFRVFLELGPTRGDTQ